MSEKRRQMEAILDDIEEAGGDGSVSVGEILSAFEDRSLGVLLVLFGTLAAIPVIGGIPGASILTATLILIAIGQSFLDRSSGIWAPRFARRREIDEETIKEALEWARPVARRVDGWIRPRLKSLVDGRPQRLVLVGLAAALALTFYPLAFVPWGVQAPSIGVVAIGLALISRDGLLALFGYLLVGLTIAVSLWLL